MCCCVSNLVVLIKSYFEKGESEKNEFLPQIFAWGLTMFLVKKDFVK